MVDTRTKGRSAKVALEQYFEELEEPAESDLGTDDDDVIPPDEALREVAWLRKEVGDLRARLAVMRGATNDNLQDVATRHPWFRITATVAGLVMLGAIISQRR
ncbi:hypothetical protein B5K06_30370 [Rhizobium grahamii]|uniref:Uncharacterized protein n=1 Tax=Rhizobium grahamii TaxID=1120045 RepID=A0A370KH64_9HYPH|nr:hypothetical protein B5K06_30370 [Rhizobium grahamii]